MNFFTKSNIAEIILSNILSTENDKNLLCKVMKVYEDDEDNYAIRVKDKDGKSWKAQIDTIKYPELHKNEIIRIKSAKGTMQEGENVLELKPHTNILRFIKDSKIVINLGKRIIDTDIDRVIRDKEEPLNELIVKKKKKSYQKMKKANLLEIYFPEEYAA